MISTGRLGVFAIVGHCSENHCRLACRDSRLALRGTFSERLRNAQIDIWSADEVLGQAYVAPLMGISAKRSYEAESSANKQRSPNVILDCHFQLRQKRYRKVPFLTDA